MTVYDLIRRLGRTVGQAEKEWKELTKPSPPTPEEIRRGILKVANDLGLESQGKSEEELREEILKRLENRYKPRRYKVESQF